MSGARLRRASLVVPASGLAEMAGSVILFSSTWSLTKYALMRGAAPLWFAEGRAALSGLTAGIFLAWIGRLKLPGRADLPALLGVGVLQLAGFFAFSHAAIAWIPVGRTAVLANTTTIWIVPLSMLILREPITRRRWMAASLGWLGVAALAGPWGIDWTSGRVLLGHAFLLAAALCWAIAIIIVRGASPNLTMMQLLPWCFAIASVVLLPLAIWNAHGGAAGADPWIWGALAYIGLVAGPAGTWCVLEASAKLPAIVSSIGFLATPALGLLLSSWFLGEPLTPDLLLGSALILAGVGVAAWPSRRAGEMR